MNTSTVEQFTFASCNFVRRTESVVRMFVVRRNVGSRHQHQGTTTHLSRLSRLVLAPPRPKSASAMTVCCFKRSAVSLGERSRFPLSEPHLECFSAIPSYCTVEWDRVLMLAPCPSRLPCLMRLIKFEKDDHKIT